MMFTVESAKKFLLAANVFYEDDDETPACTLNMNDVWCWACAWGEEVPESELPEVARLFWWYGNSGLLYWVSERHDQMTSEFYDNNRAIEFVRNEERIRKACADSTKLAYHKETYTITGARKMMEAKDD